MDPGERVAGPGAEGRRSSDPEHRSKLRFRVRFPVARYGSRGEARTWEAVDISHGGCFVQSDDLLQEKEELEIGLWLPQKGRPLEMFARARVSWVNDRLHRPARRYPLGMGLQFTHLERNDRKLLDRWLAGWAKRLTPPRAAPRSNEQAVPERTLAPGTSLGPWVIQGPLATGGTGHVYVGEHRRSGIKAALKVFHDRITRSAGNFELAKKIPTLRALEHPNLVSILDWGHQNARTYVAMELLDGRTLATHQHEMGALAPLEALDIGIQLCAALKALHAQGLMHGDLNPRNVFLLRADPSPVKLLDLGMIPSSNPAQSRNGKFWGTPGYVAPELLRGLTPNPASELYAFGVLLYEMLAGEKLFQENISSDLLHSSGPRNIPKPSSAVPWSFPPGLDETVLACLAREPSERPQSARCLLQRLEIHRDNILAGYSPVPPAPPAFSPADEAQEKSAHPPQPTVGLKETPALPPKGLARLSPKTLTGLTLMGIGLMIAMAYLGPRWLP